METQAFLASQLPLGRVILVAWLVAATYTLLGGSVALDESAMASTIVLESATLFGYYLGIVLGLRIGIIISGVAFKPIGDWILTKNKSVEMIVRGFNVGAMFLAFCLYSGISTTSFYNWLVGAGFLFVAYLYVADKLEVTS